MVHVEWVPTPSFLYRNHLYLEIVKRLPLDSYFLDIGPGNGNFVKELLSLGYKGEALDYSAHAVEFMRQNIKGFKGIKVILGDIFRFTHAKKYDAIFAFEILEHIKSDTLCMEKVYELLKPGGVFIMSVPAHMSLWAKVDELKGHFRRYEKDSLRIKLQEVGFEIETLYCYGFPFLNLLRMFSGSGNMIRSSIPSKKDKRTMDSSIQQEYDPMLASLVTSPFITKPLYFIMNLFLQTDWGIGYIVVAKK